MKTKKTKLLKIRNWSLLVWVLSIVVFMGFGALSSDESGMLTPTEDIVLITIVVVGIASFLCAIVVQLIRELRGEHKQDTDETVHNKMPASGGALYSKINSEISDVIFVPEKKEYGIRPSLIISFFLLIVVLFLVLTLSS